MDQYLDLLKKWDGDTINLCYKLYCMMDQEKTESKRFEAFCFLCMNINDVESDKSMQIDNNYIQKEELNQLINIYGDCIKAIICSIQKRAIISRMDERKFYETLWKTIFKSNLLHERKEKSYALFLILGDEGIPYHTINKPISMSNEEYQKIIQENTKTLNKIIYIFSLSFLQRTEEASLILKELEGKDEKVKAVLLSQALGLKSIENKFTEQTQIMAKTED